jgi:hypothetical protein
VTPTADTWTFQDDDAGFHEWLDTHPHGYFINAERSLRSDPFVLHRADCSHFDRDPSLSWTGEYIKVCAETQFMIERWARSAGHEPSRCSTCFG